MKAITYMKAHKLGILFKKLNGNTTSNIFIKNSFWSLLGTVLSQGSLIITSIFVARITGLVSFGEFSVNITLISIINTLTGLTIGLTATRYLARYNQTDLSKAYKVAAGILFLGLLASLAISMLFFIASDLFAYQFFNNPRLSNYFKITSVALFFGSYNGIQNSVLIGLNSYKALSFLNIKRGILNLIVLSGCAYFWGVLGALMAILMINSFMCIMTGMVISKRFKRSIRFKWSLLQYNWPIFKGFAFPTFLGGILTLSLMYISNILIANGHNGREEVGLFNAANQLRIAVLFLPSILSQPFLTTLSRKFEEKELIGLLRFIKYNILLTLIITLFFVILILYFQDFFLTLFGKDFLKGSQVLMWLLLSTIFSALCNLGANIIASFNLMWDAFALNIVWVLGFLITLYFVGATANGMAKCYLMSYLVLAIFTYLYLYIFVRRRFNLKLI